MNKVLLLFCVIAGSSVYAGGTIGGSTGCRMSVQFAETAFDIENLPKAYADLAEINKANSRLAKKGVAKVPMMLNGKQVQVRKIRDRLVDEKISNEILPSQ